MVMPLASSVDLQQTDLLHPSQTMDGNVPKLDQKEDSCSILMGQQTVSTRDKGSNHVMTTFSDFEPQIGGNSGEAQVKP